MTGGTSNVWNGAGDGTVHSRPCAPSQATLPAGAPCFSDQYSTPNIMNGVRNMPYAPMVLTIFQSENATLQSGMRRGMPASPRKCCGKNSKLTKMVDSQKCQVASFWSYMWPVHLGSQ